MTNITYENKRIYICTHCDRKTQSCSSLG